MANRTQEYRRPPGSAARGGKFPEAVKVRVLNAQGSDIEAGSVVILDYANMGESSQVFVKTTTTVGDPLTYGVTSTRILASSASPGFVTVWGPVEIAILGNTNNVAAGDIVTSGASAGYGYGGGTYAGIRRVGFALDAQTADAVLGTESGYTTVFVCVAGSNVTVDNNLYVAQNGSVNGNGSRMAPFALPSQAMAAVAADDTSIIISPGAYTETASLTWSTAYRGILMTGISSDPDATVVSGSVTNVINIDPAARANTFTASLANLQIDGDGDVSGIRIDNGTVTTKLVVNLYNVNISMNEDTYEAIEMIHADETDVGIKLYHHGWNEIEGLVVIEPGHTDDRFSFDGADFAVGINFGNTDVASRAKFRNCVVRDDSAGGDEGHDSQHLAAINCISWNGSTTWAIVDKEDFGTNISTNFKVYPAS